MLSQASPAAQLSLAIPATRGVLRLRFGRLLRRADNSTYPFELWPFFSFVHFHYYFLFFFPLSFLRLRLRPVGHETDGWTGTE